jgi:hypothetical protein
MFRALRVAAAGVFAFGCFDVETVDPHVDGVELVPDEGGWIFAKDNTIGVQGAWYFYGDQYGDPAKGGSKCTEVGMHSAEECSVVLSPVPESLNFHNVEGTMCTMGRVAVVPECKPGVPDCPSGTHDFRNVWGAGIGLNLNIDRANPDEKLVYDPTDHGILGVSFVLDMDEHVDVRVEFPFALPEGSEPPSTENHPAGSPYWGAFNGYDKSPAKEGFNRFRWNDVRSPVDDYVFDPTQILAIQFHVPAVNPDANARPQAYHFCVSELTFLRE